MGVPEGAKAQAQVPWQLLLPATHPVECDRLQQDEDLPEGQHDMPPAKSG